MTPKFMIVYVGGPWDGVVWAPKNPRGVLATHRATGWDGHYRRHSLDAGGAWRYCWIADNAMTPRATV